MKVIARDSLPFSEIAREFVGQDHGVSGISFLLLEAPPGGGPRLHRHDYDEVVVVEEGSVRFTAGERDVDMSDGDVIVVPAGTPHKFVNTGHGTLRQIDIHASSTFVTQWLEDQSAA